MKDNVKTYCAQKMTVRNFPGDWFLRKKCKILKESLITNSHEGNTEEENKPLHRI